MSHFILRQPLVRARHALPHSHGRPLERRPRAGGARRAPRNLGVADAERAAQIFLLANARASNKQPPSVTSGARSARAPVPGGLRDHLSRVKAAGRQLQAGRVARPGGRRGVPGGSAPRASLFPAARRRRGRREGRRSGAARLGGGAWPQRGACAASRPRAPRAPSAYPDPPLPPPLPATSPTGPRLT